MNKIAVIENEIRKLTPSELAQLRDWFDQYEADAWDRQIKEDVKAGRLDALAEQARKANRRGETREL